MIWTGSIISLREGSVFRILAVTCEKASADHTTLELDRDRAQSKKSRGIRQELPGREFVQIADSLGLLRAEMSLK